jgi:hypothetical protein
LRKTPVLLRDGRGTALSLELPLQLHGILAICCFAFAPGRQLTLLGSLRCPLRLGSLSLIQLTGAGLGRELLRGEVFLLLEEKAPLFLVFLFAGHTRGLKALLFLLGPPVCGAEA